MVVTLNKLKLGQAGKVVSVDGDDKIKRRLIDMGIVPDTVLKVLRFAPLGDPIEIEVLGYRLGIRKSIAKSITVEVGDYNA